VATSAPIGLSPTAAPTAADSMTPEPAVTIGEPFVLGDATRGAGAMQRDADAIMQRIAAMLPPEYVGIPTDEVAASQPTA
jgi:hypothetical protein